MLGHEGVRGSVWECGGLSPLWWGRGKRQAPGGGIQGLLEGSRASERGKGPGKGDRGLSRPSPEPTNTRASKCLGKGRGSAHSIWAMPDQGHQETQGPGESHRTTLKPKDPPYRGLGLWGRY
jgi:hypothetical protein